MKHQSLHPPMVWLAVTLLLTACGGTMPVQPQAAATAAPAVPAARLPFRGERVAVTIYEFRSSVPEIGARGATAAPWP